MSLKFNKYLSSDPALLELVQVSLPVVIVFAGGEGRSRSHICVEVKLS